MALHILVNSLYGGGAELQAALLASSLKAGLIILDDETSSRAGEAPPHATLGAGAGMPGALRTLRLPRYAAKLAALVAPGDTVLSFMQRSNFVNVLAARNSGHRAVVCEVTQPSGEFSGLRGLLMKPLIRRYYPQAALVLSNSRGNALDLEKNFGFAPGAVKVIYNSCDLAAARTRAAQNLPPGYENVFTRPVVITSGRLTQAKGQWHLLKAFAWLRRTLPNAALVLLGDGEYKADLVELCEALDLSCHEPAMGAPAEGADVYFAGFQANPFPFLARAKVFAFTSLWEGLPNAIIEALACGLPVVSADCASGPRELLAPGTDPGLRAAAPEQHPAGLLMPPFPAAPYRAFYPGADDAEKLWASTLAGLLGDEPRLAAMRTAALARAEDFSLDKQAAEWRAALGI